MKQEENTVDLKYWIILIASFGIIFLIPFAGIWLNLILLSVLSFKKTIKQLKININIRNFAQATLAVYIIFILALVFLTRTIFINIYSL